MIDWDKVAELRDEIGPTDFDEVTALFLEDTDATVAALGPGHDLEGWLHYLKGSALTMGFVELSGLCLEGEAAAARAEQVDLEEIRFAYANARTAFLRDLPGRFPQPPRRITLR